MHPVRGYLVPLAPLALAATISASPALAQTKPPSAEAARLWCVGGDDSSAAKQIAGCNAVLAARRLTDSARKAAYFLRGNAYSAQGAYDRAAADYSAALKIDPNYAGAWRGRGEAHFRRKEFALAISDDSTYIKLDPNGDGWLARSAAYLSTGQLDEAITDLSEMIKQHPNAGAAYTNRGEAYRQKGELDLALNDLDRAI